MLYVVAVESGSFFPLHLCMFHTQHTNYTVGWTRNGRSGIVML